MSRSWRGFDQRAISWVVQSGTDPDSNRWIDAFTLLGKAWLQIWLLLVWFVASGRRREVLAGILAPSFGDPGRRRASLDQPGAHLSPLDAGTACRGLRLRNAAPHPLRFSWPPLRGGQETGARPSSTDLRDICRRGANKSLHDHLAGRTLAIARNPNIQSLSCWLTPLFVMRTKHRGDACVAPTGGL